jgi:serine/threonine protein kinase
MSVVPGTTLDEHEKQLGYVDPEVAAAAEKELLALHAYGIAHADTHAGNFIVSPTMKKVTLIDFGMARVLPEYHMLKMREAIQSAVASLFGPAGEWPTNNINRLWYANEKSAMPYLVGIHRKLNYSFFNPDGKFLRLENTWIRGKRQAAGSAFSNPRVRAWRSFCMTAQRRNETKKMAGPQGVRKTTRSLWR